MENSHRYRFIEPWKSWRCRQRYREVISVCLPLVLGLAAITVMEFTDRVFLANYSLTAISAALPAGITSFLLLATLAGIAGYGGVFIAQYYGAGTHEKIGAVLWQGLYFCMIGGVLLVLAALFLTTPLFAFMGHATEIRAQEEIYFAIMCYGGVFYLLSQTLSAFFSGRGFTRTVMIANFVAMAINIPLDYVLIFGFWVIPEMGIAGAALATVGSTALSMLLLGALTFTQRHEASFGVLSARRFNPGLFGQLLRFGIPGSLQFSIDILAFTVFIAIVGRLGMVELAATNIVLSINALAFMVAMGASLGVSVIVGQALGRGAPEQAHDATISAAHLLLLYILIIDLLFIFLPYPLISLFIPTHHAGPEGQAVVTTAATLLRIVACYLFFDALYMIFSGALKGAGDTRFLMLAISGASAVCFIGPLYVGLEILNKGVYFAWGCLLCFIISLFILVTWRYGAGAWHHMLVIEKPE